MGTCISKETYGNWELKFIKYWAGENIFYSFYLGEVDIVGND